METYDLVIIGGGSAGLAAAEYASKFGKSIALIEDDRLGGGSLWSGCIPSKTLLHEAHHVHAHGAHKETQAYKEVQNKIKEAQQTIVRLHDNPEHFKNLGVTVHIGMARFKDKHTVIVGKEELTSKFFLVATGSQPAIPPVKGLDTISYLTTDTIFELEKVPQSLIVIGGGANGVELAQAFNRLGVKVTLLHRGSRLLSHDDEDVSEFILKKLTAEGVIVKLNASLTQVAQERASVTVTYEVQGTAQKEHADALLVVTGRKSQVGELGLDKAGVFSDKRGVGCNSYLQTSVPHIYIAGDVVGEYGFTHFAAAQGVHAVSNMFTKPREFNPKLVPWVTFCYPEAAHVGMTEEELKKSGKTYKKLFLPYSEIDRAVIDSKEEGFIKILVGEDGLIQGAQIVGERAGELIHEIVTAMEFGISFQKLVSVIHAYPTYSSGLGQLFFQAQGKDKTPTQNKESQKPVALTTVLNKLSSLSR